MFCYYTMCNFFVNVAAVQSYRLICGLKFAVLNVQIHFWNIEINFQSKGGFFCCCCYNHSAKETSSPISPPLQIHAHTSTITAITPPPFWLRYYHQGSSSAQNTSYRWSITGFSSSKKSQLFWNRVKVIRGVTRTYCVQSATGDQGTALHVPALKSANAHVSQTSSGSCWWRDFFFFFSEDLKGPAVPSDKT